MSARIKTSHKGHSQESCSLDEEGGRGGWESCKQCIPMEGKARVDAEADATGNGVGWGHAGVGGLPDVPSVNLEALIRLAKVIETGSSVA